MMGKDWEISGQAIGTVGTERISISFRWGLSRCDNPRVQRTAAAPPWRR
jgi:hypothetical protein